jgi:glucose-specific phosphotransferase system IIA component
MPRSVLILKEVNVFNFTKKNTNVTLVAPVTGTSILLENVKDQVFSSKVMGEGVAFEFEGDMVYSPCDGTLSVVFPTWHAFGVTCVNGAEVLIHIGIDTVNLKGEGFTCFVKQGDKVKAGDPIIKIDREFMKEKNVDLTTSVVISNHTHFNCLFEPANKQVKASQDKIALISKKRGKHEGNQKDQ